MKKKTFIKEGAYQKVDNSKGKVIRGALDLSKEILDVLVNKGLITTEDCCNYEVAGGSSYLVYTALLTQTGTDAPVATVLENTLGGTVVWTYDDVGFFIATLNGVFTENKTYSSASLTNDDPIVRFLGARWGSVDEIYLVSRDINSNATNEFYNATIEIRVYP